MPEHLIRTRYVRSIGLLDQACRVANRAYVFDNSGAAHELLAEIVDGEELHIHAAQLPAWFTETTLWQSFQAPSDSSEASE